MSAIHEDERFDDPTTVPDEPTHCERCEERAECVDGLCETCRTTCVYCYEKRETLNDMGMCAGCESRFRMGVREAKNAILCQDCGVRPVMHITASSELCETCYHDLHANAADDLRKTLLDIAGTRV